MKIDATAIIHPTAELANDVEVGPYATIGEGAVIGGDTRVGPRVSIERWTRIGSRCRIFTGAVVGSISQDMKYRGEKSSLVIGDNNTIREYVTINLGSDEKSQTTIGNDNLLMAYAHVAHDCRVGNNVILANGATLAGHVVIEDGAIIGGLVAIHQFDRVGTLAIVGGCSKVVKDVPPYSMVDGHPTRVYGLNSVGLRRAGLSGELRSNLKHAFKILCNLKLAIPSALERIKEEVPDSPEVAHLIQFVESSKRGICR